MAKHLSSRDAVVGQAAPSVTMLVITASVLIAIAWSSVLLSHFFFSTLAWNETFGQIAIIEGGPEVNVGWLFEGARATLIIGLAVWVLGRGFHKEIRVLLGRPSIEDDPVSKVVVYGMRFAFVLIAMIGTYTLVRHHYEFGPETLLPLHPESESKADHRYTYAWYFPYSFVLFIVTDVSLLLVPLFGGFLDNSILRQLNDRLKKHIGEPDRRHLLDKLFLDEFELPHRQLLLRYIDLYAAIAVICALEYIFFSHTLSDFGRFWILLATAIILLNFVCVYQVYRAYDVGYQEVLNSGGVKAEWASEYSPFSFVKRILFHTSSGLVLWVILVIPSGEAIKSLFR